MVDEKGKNLGGDEFVRNRPRPPQEVGQESRASRRGERNCLPEQALHLSLFCR